MIPARLPDVQPARPHLALPFLTLICCLWFLSANHSQGQNASPPTLLFDKSTNGIQMLKWAPYPSADQYTIRRTPSIDQPFLPDISGVLSNSTFIPNMSASNGFFRLEVVPMPTNRLQASIALNRLTYGPTPDDIEYWSTNAIDAFIEQQLAPESISEIEDDLVTFTNTVGANTFRWVYVQQTGIFTASGTNGLYIYLNGSGTAYVDDLKVVAGTNLAGPNLIPTGDFEGTLAPPWLLGTNCLGSTFTSEASKSGLQALKVVFTNAGNTGANAVHFTNTSLGLTANQICTLSYWYVPSTNRQLTIRLSNNGVNTTPDAVNNPNLIYRRLLDGTAGLSDLRRWFCRRAVRANRQLLEVMTQFWENHFVTQHSKSVEYLDRYYDDFTLMGVLAAELEFREIGKWRTKMMDPNATFYDMLRISAESPAMIMYLDTARSKGNNSNIANENYARELLELFTFGVDNGYDQNDITVMSRAWTGWTINLVDPSQANNPFLTNYVYDGSSAYVTNLPGIWTLSYMWSNHNNTAKTVFPFPSKAVPARFGPPWAGSSYQLALPVRSSPNGGVNGGTNGITDGYDVISHLANQPFTMEYMSVKLCRWFVHEDFDHGVYDYTDPNLSAEGRLVHDCMLAWHNATPRGNLRTVLRTIFNSELFRTHAGAGQKVKTPLEFAASTIRALRSFDTNGFASADTDGNFATSLSRMGSMLLFDRAEPNGYPEAGSGWVSAGTLVERLRFAQSVLMSSNLTQSIDAGSGFMSDPVRLLKRKLPSNQWNNASSVADLFLFYLYPGEGRANLDVYKNVALKFLNTADDGVSDSQFSVLVNAASYDSRVRGMVAMLMTLPRFQEQ